MNTPTIRRDQCRDWEYKDGVMNMIVIYEDRCEACKLFRSTSYERNPNETAFWGWIRSVFYPDCIDC